MEEGKGWMGGGYARSVMDERLGISDKRLGIRAERYWVRNEGLG